MRKILGIIVGAIVAMILITIVERAGHAVFPPATDLDMSTAAGVARYIATSPSMASAAVVFGWFAGAAVGGWTALRISQWPLAGWTLAGVIAFAGIANATQIPAPLWMQLSTVLAPALGGWVALHLPGWQRTTR